uniref:Membrane-spanning 4-domains subfamily A member 4A-like n=1 Tax=Pelusios castaneus TaxID=367368 RepID=A0A8C8S6F7_9SAUR
MASTAAACPDGTITIVNRIITQPHTASVPAPATPQLLDKFYKGEPLALGVTQILVGAVQVAVGVVMNMSHPFSSNDFLWYIPMWSGMLYIISGSLSMAAAKNTKIPLVKGSLGMNIISAVVAGSALIVYLIFLTGTRHEAFCVWYPEKCLSYKLNVAFSVVLFLFTFLEFCVSICTAAFGCKTICYSYSEVSVVIYQKVMPPDDPTTATNSPNDAVAYTSPAYKDLTTL